MTSELTLAIDRLTNAEDEEQLRELDENLGKFIPEECGEVEFRCLLGVFERFPDEDGFGVFWTIVHLLEACKGYQPALVQSVLRKPGEFNVLMINRLINGGVTVVDDQSLFALLTSVASNTAASPNALSLAERLLKYQHEQGCTEA